MKSTSSIADVELPISGYLIALPGTSDAGEAAAAAAAAAEGDPRASAMQHQVALSREPSKCLEQRNKKAQTNRAILVTTTELLVWRWWWCAGPCAPK